MVFLNKLSADKHDPEVEKIVQQIEPDVHTVKGEQRRRIFALLP